MDATTSSEQERAEVDLVLQSGVFDKAPRLGHFFRYICDRHFEGRADQIKEYSIALEALGRGSDFDPKRDSIVRVEAHRLRKRLEDYYRGAGADHLLQIAIPNGQYRPQFISRQSFSPPALKPEEEKPELRLPALRLVELRAIEPAPAPPARAFPQPLRWLSIAVSAALLLSAAGYFFLQHSRRVVSQTPAVPVDKWNTAVWSDTGFRPGGAELRILAGYHGAPYIDRQGHTWNPDAFFRGGSVQAIPSDRFIEGQPDPHLIRSTRYGRFRYDIPLPPGTYELHLLFAETMYGGGNPLGGGDATRTFDIGANGQTLMPLFDPLAQAGAPNRLQEVVLKDITPAADGALHLRFDPQGSAPAILSAFEILPSQRGRVHPVRMVTQANPVTDSDGRVWAADEYFLGGTEVLRENVLPNSKERALYQGERYGNFQYRIPLAPGKYRLTLHFAEQWFGTPSTSQNLDYRVFDVYANRRPLLKDFHVGREAKGPNRSLEKHFDNIQPDAQGILLLEFVPQQNYAEVNAIEVTQMP